MILIIIHSGLDDRSTAIERPDNHGIIPDPTSNGGQFITRNYELLPSQSNVRTVIRFKMMVATIKKTRGHHENCCPR